MAGGQTAEWREAVERLPDAGFIRPLACYDAESACKTGIPGG